MRRGSRKKQQQQQNAAKGSSANSMAQLQNDNKTVTTAGKLGKLDEMDILLLENSSYADNPRKPYEQRSICDKLV